MITRHYYLTTRPYTFEKRSATVRESPYSTLVSTTNSVKHCGIALQGLYTIRNTFCMHVSNPCATYILSVLLAMFSPLHSVTNEEQC